MAAPRVTIIGGDLLTGKVRVRNIPARSASVTQDFGAGKIDAAVKLPLRDPETGALTDITNILEPGRSFLGYVIGGTKIVEAGPIWTDSTDMDSGRHAFHALGLRSIFAYRYVLDLLINGQLPKDKLASFTGVNLRTQAKRLVQLAQAWNPTLPIVLEADFAGTSERNYPGSELMRMSDALDNLESVIDGPDIRFRPVFTDSTRTYVQWLMETGNPVLSQSPGADHVFDTSVIGSTVKGLAINRDARVLVTDSFQQGEELVTEVADTADNEPADDDPDRLEAVAFETALLYSNIYRNLFKYPSMETADTVWNNDGTSVTLTRVTDTFTGWPKRGTYSQKAVAGSTSIASCLMENAVAADVISGQPHTERIWIRNSAAGSRTFDVWLRFYTAAFAEVNNVQVGAVVLAAGEIRAFDITGTPGPLAVKAKLNVRRNSGGGAANGDTFHFDAWTLVQGTDAMDIDGDMPDDATADYVWENPLLPGASTSLRMIRTGYPRMQEAEIRYSVKELDTLQDYADGAVVRGQFLEEVWEFKARKNSTPKLDDYNAHDFAVVVLGEDQYRKPAGRYRVRIMSLDADLGPWVTIRCAPERVPV